MAAAVANIVTKKMFKEVAENNFGQKDPYFEMVPATNMLGRKKMKKRRKAAPEGISENDAKVLTKVKRRAYRLDLCLCNCCGIRFGWGSVIGIIPAFGDAIDAFFALMVALSCTKIDGGLPASIQARMLFNIALDFVIGLVPFVGDLADALYKCNTRNAVLLERYLEERGRNNLKKRAKGIGQHAHTEGDSEHTSGVLAGPSRDDGRSSHDSSSPRRPSPARLPREDSARHESRREPRRSRGSRERERDLEMG